MRTTDYADYELTRVRELAEELMAEGYEVEYAGGIPQLPPEYASYRPDIVAHKGGEHLAIEVKSRGPQIMESMSVEVADLINRLPGWRFKLVVLPPQEQRPSHEAVTTRAAEARQLLGNGFFAPAMLIVWSAVEGALRILAANRGETLRSAAGYLSDAYSRDVISDRQFEVLTRGLRVRNEIAHGYESSPDPAVVEDLALLAEWLASEEFVPVSEMVEWFVEEYENPAEHVPFETAEGGYQYYAGGPYDAEEQLASAFPHADEKAIEEAARMVEAEGADWVRRGQYP